MIDIDLLVKVLRRHGHRVGSVIPVPDNAGDYELNVDGNLIPLIEARRLLEQEDARRSPAASSLR